MYQLKDFASYTIYLLITFLEVDLDLAQALMWSIGIDTALGISSAIFTRNERALIRCEKLRKSAVWYRRPFFCWRFKKGRFSRSKLLKGFYSKLSLLLVPILVALGAISFGYDLKWSVSVSIKLIIASDIISSLNHILYFRTGRRSKKNDVITHSIEYIRDIFVNKAKELFNIKEGNTED